MTYTGAPMDRLDALMVRWRWADATQMEQMVQANGEGRTSKAGWGT